MLFGSTPSVDTTDRVAKRNRLPHAWLALAAFVASVFGLGLGAAQGFVGGSGPDLKADDSGTDLPRPINPSSSFLLPCIPPLPPDPGTACRWILTKTVIEKQHPQTVFKDQQWKVQWHANFPNGCAMPYCEGLVPPPIAVGPIVDEFGVVQSYMVSGSLELAIETGAIGKAIADASASVSFNGEIHNSKTRTFTVNFPLRCVPFCMYLPYKELVNVGNATVEVADWRVTRTYRLEQSPFADPFVICDFGPTTTTSCQAGNKAKVEAGGGNERTIEQKMKTCGPCPQIPCDHSDQPNSIEILPPDHPCSQIGTNQ